MRFADQYGFYELNPFPGCNQIVVSNHAFIYPQFRGQGHGKQQHQERLRKAKELGYDLIICTVKSDNDREREMLQKNGWLYRSGFVSTETGHGLQIWDRQLKDV